jgi:hypothetical protein
MRPTSSASLPWCSAESTDAGGSDAVLAEVRPRADDLAAALLQQPGPVASGPVDTSLGGYPAIRADLTVREEFELETCRLEGFELQIWYSQPADKSVRSRSLPRGRLCTT